VLTTDKIWCVERKGDYSVKNTYRFLTVVTNDVAQGADITNIIFNLLQGLNNEDVAQVVAILWSIWKQRNRGSAWNKSLIGRLKCNIDAFFTRDKVDIGVCLIDASGAFVIAKMKWFLPICDVHVGEALGLLSALNWVHEFNL
jgi:hypothetical protein